MNIVYLAISTFTPSKDIVILAKDAFALANTSIILSNTSIICANTSVKLANTSEAQTMEKQILVMQEDYAHNNDVIYGVKLLMFLNYAFLLKFVSLLQTTGIGNSMITSAIFQSKQKPVPENGFV